MKIYIGSDHRGFDLKEKLKNFLEENNYKFEDVGANEYRPDDDYTEFASKLAEKITAGKFRGILICGSGVGMDIAANKFDGVRASIGISPEQVASGRNDDDMNVLVIASDHVSEEEAENMLKTFLETEFDGEDRHKERLETIEKIEETN